MKVICVKPFKTNKCYFSGTILSVPDVGDEDIVIDVFETKYGVHYALERFGMDNLYNSEHFATLPDDTADEMQEAEQESILM